MMFKKHLNVSEFDFDSLQDKTLTKAFGTGRYDVNGIEKPTNTRKRKQLEEARTTSLKASVIRDAEVLKKAKLKDYCYNSEELEEINLKISVLVELIFS